MSCPPHYWLIENLDFHTQQWTCQRCGVKQAHDVPAKLGPSWAPPPRFLKTQ